MSITKDQKTLCYNKRSKNNLTFSVCLLETCPYRQLHGFRCGCRWCPHILYIPTQLVLTQGSQRLGRLSIRNLFILSMRITMKTLLLLAHMVLVPSSQVNQADTVLVPIPLCKLCILYLKLMINSGLCVGI